jgi:hypothetical protein
MKKLSKVIVGLGAVVVLVSAYSMGIVGTAGSADASSYIEVCSRGVVYVPPETRYVTCHGKIMKVVGIVSGEEGAESKSGGGAGDCYCPKCCGGYCAVIVHCGPVPESAAGAEDCASGPRTDSGNQLCTMYLACGD